MDYGVGCELLPFVGGGEKVWDVAKDERCWKAMRQIALFLTRVCPPPRATPYNNDLIKTIIHMDSTCVFTSSNLHLTIGCIGNRVV